jgi:radical SAM protein with 4Fe4S-binding SPASM domain
MQEAHRMGFSWGMTSNATFITRDVARKLREAGMGTISVSIDGLPETHDRLRGLPGGWKRAMQGIQNLIDEGGFRAIQVTTVLNHQNMQELDRLYEIFEKVDLDSWRVVGLEPIGRAKEHPDLMLTPEDQRRMFDFIREKREADIPVQYGCSHFLGLDYEREVRDWYFHCTAGTYIASICANGDITACLDIERRPEFIQGNILRDRFKDVWEQKFRIFRRDLAEENEKCRNCAEKQFCHGDSFHSWDFDKNEPQLCMKGILFDET